MSKFVDCNRNQAYLLPPDLRDWIPEDDLAHFVIEAVERVPMSAFQVNERGTGSAQVHPQMMLALLIYCYANGIFSSRGTRARHPSRHRGPLRGGEPASGPRHDRDVSAEEPGGGERELSAGAAAGSGDEAAEGRHGERGQNEAGRQRRQAPLGEIRPGGRADGAAQSGDRGTDGAGRGLRWQRGGGSAGPAGGPGAQGKTPRARQRLEARARDSAEAERAACAAQATAREAHEEPASARTSEPPEERPPAQDRAKARQSVCETGAPEPREEKARPPPTPKERPKAREQDNLSDPDSRLMRRSRHHEFRQAYNAQATVDAEGSQLILGAGVSQSASDRRELVAGVTAIPAPLGRPTTVLADNGYASGEQVARLAEMKVEALVATGTEGRRRHDFRPAGPSRPARQPKAPWIQAMAERLASKEGRDRYRLRRQTVEPVFGIIKSVLGFRRFSLRGIEKVNGEWDLVAVAYNCKRLHKLQIGA